MLSRGEPYQLRDNAGTVLTERAARQLVATHFTVPEQVRARARAHTAATHRAKLTR